MDRKFPRIVIDRDKLRNNCTQIVKHCEARGIAVAGVIKGAGGLPEIARLYRSCGAAQLATSRLEQMELWRREGIPGPYMLLRVPGIGVTSAHRILTARRVGPLTCEGLKRLGVVLKRAQYFLTCSGRMLPGLSRVRPDGVLRRLVALEQPALAGPAPAQLSLFDPTG